MVFPKFIIERDKLIIGVSILHRQLATNNADVIGGGWYYYKEEDKTIVFFGRSIEFGQAKYGDIEKCVKAKRVFLKDGNELKNISNDYKFQYKIDGILIDLN